MSFESLGGHLKAGYERGRAPAPIGRHSLPDWRFPTRDATLNIVESNRLADPAFEPSDEDLIGLSKRAFAHVREAHEASLNRLRAEIAAARKASLERLYAKWPEFKAAG